MQPLLHDFDTLETSSTTGDPLPIRLHFFDTQANIHLTQQETAVYYIPKDQLPCTVPVTINGCPVYFVRLLQCDNRQGCLCKHVCSACSYAQDKGWVKPPYPTTPY